MQASDFDIVIENKTFAQQEPIKCLVTLRRALSMACYAAFASIEIIENARVPLAKFTTPPCFGEFSFDVSLSSGGPLVGPSGASVALDLL